MASVHDETRYPCQCGKVFSRKYVRLRHQRTCPKRSDSQSMQLEPCMADEPTPKTSTIPSIPWLEANSQSGMGTSKTYDPRFRVPGSMQIVGPTLSGKTTWLSKLIQDAATYFRDDTGESARFQQALYCYGSSWQPMFTGMQQDMGVTFHPGIPTIPWEEVFPPEQRPSLLVLDDLMRETVDSDQVMDLLSKKAHHLNLFVIVVTQNLYALGKHSVGMNRNYQYTILFRNPADTRYIKTLGQRWMGDAKRFTPLYERATTLPYGYLVVDHHPQTPEEIRFRFNVLKDEPGYIGVLQPIKQH